MRMNNYGSLAALGITRVGDDKSGIVRQISMAGFGVIGAGDNPAVPYHESNVTAGTQCAKDNTGTAPWSRYCGCMYGEADRISTDKKGSGDFRTGSARWACQTAAEANLTPWNCEAVIFILLSTGGQADPLRHLSGTLTSGPKGAEYRRCAEKVVDTIEKFYSGARPALEAMGVLPRSSASQPVTGGAIADPAAYTEHVKALSDATLATYASDPYVDAERAYRAANPCAVGYARNSTSYAADGRPTCKATRMIGVGPVRPTLPITIPIGGSVPKDTGGSDASGGKSIPTGAIVGAAALAVAAVFFLKK